MALLKLEKITKSFGGLMAVNGVSLEIEQGETIAIVGPNGAGKTTLFNVISGIYPPDSGRVIFGGKDISRLPVMCLSHWQGCAVVAVLFSGYRAACESRSDLRLAAQAAGCPRRRRPGNDV